MALDLAATQSAIVAGLPVRRRWLLAGTPLDFDFSCARRGLRNVTTEDVVGDIDEAWVDLIIFGKCDVAEGGGAAPWITIRDSDGAVCGLDVERERSVVAYNSSLERFIRTFALIDGCLGEGRPLSPAVATRIQHLDPECYIGSEWQSMIEYLRDEQVPPGDAG